MNAENLYEKVKELEYLDKKSVKGLKSLKHLFSMIDCEEISYIPENPTNDIFLLQPILDKIHISKNRQFAKIQRPELEDLIEYHFGYEILLEDENYYTCNYCKDIGEELKTTAIKKIFLYKPPPVLTIVIKRFT